MLSETFMTRTLVPILDETGDLAASDEARRFELLPIGWTGLRVN